jgi:N-acyl-D-aspartate/D-glutamate deacylase
MGEEAADRAATEAEVAQMRRIVREAMDVGAVGLSTSNSSLHLGYQGKPVPSRLAAYEETRSLASVLGEVGRGVFQTTPGPQVSFKQFRQIAEENRVPVTWTGMFASMAVLSVDHRLQMARSEALVEQGLPIHPQVSARPLNFEFQMKSPLPLAQLRPIREAMRADTAGQRRLYADPDFRGAFRAALGEASAYFLAAYRQMVIVGTADPALAERKLEEVARERGVDAAELMFDLALRSDLEERFRMPIANHIEDECQELLFSKGAVLALSDAGAHVSQLCDAVMPTYFLGRWHREKQAVDLERAVWMLTGWPAKIFGLHDRGRLAEGWPADIVVFDPATVHAAPLRRVHDLPAGGDRLIADAIGVDAVVVNGVLLRRGGREVLGGEDRLPGRLLRARGLKH